MGDGGMALGGGTVHKLPHGRGGGQESQLDRGVSSSVHWVKGASMSGQKEYPGQERAGQSSSHDPQLQVHREFREICHGGKYH